MKKMKKITALILAGVLCTSSLSGIPAKTLLASDECTHSNTIGGADGYDTVCADCGTVVTEGNGTSALIQRKVIDFQGEGHKTLFESKDNEAWTSWGIVDSPVTDDTDNKVLKFTSTATSEDSTNKNYQFSKYQLKEKFLSGTTIQSVQGRIAVPKANTSGYSGVFVVTQYSSDTSFEGFRIYASTTGTTTYLNLTRAKTTTGSNLMNNNPSSWEDTYTDVYGAVDASVKAECTLTKDAYVWVDWKLEYYEADDNVGGGYRAKMTLSQGESVLLTNLTVVSAYSNVLMFTSDAYETADTNVYLDDIQCTLLCSHATTAEVAEVQYLAYEGDCQTYKTYYKSCASCGEATSETFETTILGDHKSSVTEEGYDKLCDLCGYCIGEGNGTSELVDEQLLDFEKAEHRVLFESQNSEAWANWGIVASPVTDDAENFVLKLTSLSSTAVSKYQVKDKYISGTTVQSVSGRLAIKKNDTAGLYVITEYTDDATTTGFWIYSDSSGYLWLMRAKPDTSGTYVLTANNPSSWQTTYPDVYEDTQYRYSTQEQNVVLTADYTWVDFQLEYYTGESISSTGYRAKMTLSQNGNTLLTLPTVVSKMGSQVMFATAGAGKTIYLDDIKVTLAEQTCAHTNVAEVEDEIYLASAGDCQTCKTYYKSCSDCGETLTETFTSQIYGAHDLTAHDEKSGSCTEEGKKAYWSCSVCEKKFLDEDATQEVADETVLIIPAGHSWNEAYVSDATQHWHTCSKCESGVSETEAHTWCNDAENPNKLKCSVCGYVTAEDVLPMICGAKILADTDDADATQYLRYDIDFSAMKNNAETCGLTVSEYGVIAVGTTKAEMTLQDVLALSANNPNTKKSQTDLTKLGDSGVITVKIQRKAEDYGRRTTIVAFMKVGDATYYSYNSDYTQDRTTYTGVANNGIASKGVMDIMKPYLYNGTYGTEKAPSETELTYTAKAFDNFWTALSDYQDAYDVFGIWGEEPVKETIKSDYLDNYISGAMTVPQDTTSEDYQKYQAAKQLAVCVFCEANELKSAVSE